MKMKYFVFLILMPYIFAEEIKPAVCINGLPCPEGKYCCELPSGELGCCELSKVQDDNGYVPGLPASSLTNQSVSMAHSQNINPFCPGVQCGPNCFPDAFLGKCCDDQHVCTVLNICCRNSESTEPWCCPQIPHISMTRCGPVFKKCIKENSGATSISVMSVLLTFIIAVISKHLI